MYNDINISELKKIYNDVILIDIRNASNYNNGHIGNALNIPFQSLVANPKKYLNFNDVYYIYCQQGVTSLRLCSYLRKRGYKAVNINGGYEEWVLEN